MKRETDAAAVSIHFRLPSSAYPAEGGAEFIHGEAPVTRALLREAGLSLLPIEGMQRSIVEGKLSSEDPLEIHEAKLHAALRELKDDVTVAEFLRRQFGGAEYDRLRRSIERMVESYDAADPERASTLALRDEWMNEGRSTQVRIVGGYGGLIDFLVKGCRSQGAGIKFRTVVKAIDYVGVGAIVRCANGDTHECDAVVLTVPLPLLKEIALPSIERERAAAAAHIGSRPSGGENRSRRNRHGTLGRPGHQQFLRIDFTSRSDQRSPTGMTRTGPVSLTSTWEPISWSTFNCVRSVSGGQPA